MPVDRPTFSESWYRVSALRPKLRATVHTVRQEYRGKIWHVLQDAANNQYFRLDEAGYRFVGMLDGQRTVEEVWRANAEQMGDHAPTQGEAINLLGQLYIANLLQSDLPADAAGMFDRYRNRVRREISGFLINLLFARIPLFDPDALLERWVKLMGLAFTWVGLACWLAILATGLYFIGGRWDELLNQASPQQLLKTENLLLLYGCFAVIKAVHELGHGFACKHFGVVTGTGGEVHTLGIMLMVFTPCPYVDATSSWAFRSRWHRAIVGAAGMYFELVCAAIAAVVWSQTDTGTLVHALSYNVLVVAGFTTVVFNLNPLVRFDGYYILCDLLEIPNLAQRSGEQIKYLVRKYAFGVRRAQPQANTPGEEFWLPVYAAASFVYRTLVTVGIILFVFESVFFYLGLIISVVTIVGWLVMPVLKFIRYLLTDAELMRVRTRAMTVTAVTVSLVLIPLGAIPMPDRGRAEGITEPRAIALMYTEVDGFVRHVLPSGTEVRKDDQALVSAENLELEVQLEKLRAEHTLTQIRMQQASTQEIAVAQSLDRRAQALRQQIERTQQRLDALNLRSPIDGVWISPQGDWLPGSHLKRGQQVGLVASTSALRVRAAADQAVGPRLRPEIGENATVEMRVQGNPQAQFNGIIEKILPPNRVLPTPALGFLAGGSLRVSSEDRERTRTIDPFYEVLINVSDEDVAKLKLCSGQRVVIRFTMPSRPLLAQWWNAGRRLVQRRLGI